MAATARSRRGHRGLAGSAVLIVYGAAQVTGEALAETGAIRPPAPADWTAQRWHLGLRDPWLLLGRPLDEAAP